ncbi:MAG: hypothetical protein CR986_01295 [Ignavibacteriae bacterium]|nr:MAG: hypothetical protein CR986_01295 [Ignavibacteriota bacterium]
MRIHLSLLVIFSLYFISCSSGEQSVKSSQKVNEPKTNISKLKSKIDVQIPEGWYKIDDNYEKLFEFWLVNKEKTASIVFIPINFDSVKTLKNNTEILDFLTKLSLSGKKFTADNFEIISRTNNSLFPSYNEVKFILNNSLQNLIVFSKDKSYFECLAYFNEDYEPTNEEFERLITTQKKVLSKLKVIN